MASSWFGSSADSDAPWPDGLMAVGSYELRGEVTGGARRVRYCHDGKWWRAADAETEKDRWISGPDGSYLEFDHPDGPVFIPRGLPAVFRRPLPELGGLGSIDQLRGWLDLRLEPAGDGRWRNPTADVTVDVESGVVLNVELTGVRRLSLRTSEFRLVAATESVFEYAGPTREWQGPVAGPLAG